LATCQVKAKTCDGQFVSIRVLLDPGSELSFIAEELVHRLKLPRKSAAIPLLGIGGTFSGRTKGSVHVSLHSEFEASDFLILQAFILSRLTFKVPSFKVATVSWTHLNNLQIADPNFCKPGPIHIIIGADSYGQVIRPELIRGDPLSPIAQLTLFGWVVSGPAAFDTHDEVENVFHCAVDRDLQDLLTCFWKQDDLPKSTVISLSPDETECEEYFRSTVSRNQSGRYIVRLPLKSPATLLGDSSISALRILSRLRKRLISDPSYEKLYTDFLHEYHSLGHMNPVEEVEVLDSPVYYLPHHGVLRENSLTTKLRVVFNGSYPSSSGVSLNDLLHSGAKLQTNIFDVLLKFRSYQIVFSSDITKMYRQILVHPADRNLQRIFWFNSSGQPCPYQLTTVTYGLNCAPFLALRVLQQLISDEGHRFPKAVASLSEGRYVDDIFGGADSVEEAQEIMTQVIQLCMAGGFPLQKWNSNHPALLKSSLSEKNHASTVELDSTRTKVLGINWQPQIDTLNFTSVPPKGRSITKRSVLSEIAQLYDPLGLIAPVVVRAKIFIQELWLAKIDWDTPLPLELQHRWITYKQQLPTLSYLNIPRWLFISSAVRSIELHGFADASQLAMAAAVYIRVEMQTSEVRVTLACAKTKVAPLKKLTIPRLELNAALILSRLVTSVQNALNMKENSVFLWSDSSIVLTWITTHPAKWKDYVRNRVTLIQEGLPSARWRYVPGKENPADCASRGISASEIGQHSLWWFGPSWLNQAPDTWPKLNSIPSTVIDMEAQPKHALVSLRNHQVTPWDLLERYSSLSKLIRITAMCKRAVQRFRRLSTELLSVPLTPLELEESCQFWIRQVQQSHFQLEIKILTNKDRLSKSNPLIRLTPFLDEYGLIRVGGRLQNTNVELVKHPYILPKQSTLTTLVIADAHLKTLHGGTQVTLAYTRQKYWILGGRTPVRSFILRCVRCARYRQIRAQQLMGQLPKSRVTPSRPFLNTGVDYAGPVVIKTWRGRAAKTYKGYLAIFVCLATSAVHIEVVTEYTTEAFISAYKRFTARRGICATLQSDCGTNFVGADRELRRRFDSASKELKEVAAILANHGTTWRFTPPAAPHFGGKWEAAVKSTKFHLRRMIGDTILTYEELTTLTVQIEAILNSRPLCPLSADIEDYTALTPGHFLLGDAPTIIPEPNFIDQPISRLTRWQLIRQRVDHFWKRWMSECLQRYQAISKWHHSSVQIKEGALVLVIDERYPPAKWPLARVLQLHPGKDGLTRVVTLRTCTTIFKRPITKLCILPVDEEHQLFGNFVPEGGRNVRVNSKVNEKDREK